MKKYLTALCMFALSLTLVKSQNLAITLSTSKAIGESFVFQLKAKSATEVNVDFGNGSLSKITVESASNTLIEGTLKGSSVKVYGTAGTKISYLDCHLSNITSMDLTNAIDLEWLDCHTNQLATLDLSKSVNLKYLNCNDNLLTTLDISKNAHLLTIQCKNNLLTFATLPIESAFTAFISEPQLPISIAKNFDTGNTADLSATLTGGGNTTKYVWKTKSGAVLTDGTDYAIKGGKTIFLKPQADSVFCEMTNASFPDFKEANVLKTYNTKITGANVSTMSMTTSKSLGASISFTLQANTDNSAVQVDFGDGSLVKKTINTYESIISGTLVGSQTVKIYGTDIIYLDCNNQQITNLDVTQNIALEGLDCYGNQINTLDLTKNTALEGLGCDNNQLSTLDVSKNTALTALYCSSNNIETLNVSENIELQALNFSHNRLSSIDVTKNTKLTSFTCDNNNLSAIDISKNSALFNLTCQNNKLTFASLPTRAVTFTEYRYAPQQPIAIAKSYLIGSIIDLSAQLIAGTATTVYKIKTKAGTTMVKDVDYSITDGKITLLKAQTDSIYCEMTNTTFPNLKGSDALKTTYTLVSVVSKQNQTITFNAIPDKKTTDAPFALIATASSNLPISFTSSDPSVASINGSTVTIIKAGTITITATQAGNDNWNPASAEQKLTITPVTSIWVEKEDILSVYPNPVAEILYVKGEGYENINISIVRLPGTLVWNGIVRDQRIDISNLPAGIYILKMSTKDHEERTIRFVKK